ncbi:hypothetical protein SAZ11_24150 [Streptomyces sp. FXJ1.4098]|uniref:hypothetical protein n=1 Tax=Streptomyces sp. NPDC020845 TaxID=3365096 RepID=UPI00299BFB13|nr:hypothetical protein [Streptomyces sp. FXJ1.4098]
MTDDARNAAELAGDEGTLAEKPAAEWRVEWDTGSQPDPRLRSVLRGHTYSVNAVSAVVVEGRHLVINVDASDGTIRMWDPATGRPAGEPLVTGTGWRLAGLRHYADRGHPRTYDVDAPRARSPVRRREVALFCHPRRQAPPGEPSGRRLHAAAGSGRVYVAIGDSITALSATAAAGRAGEARE